MGNGEYLLDLDRGLTSDKTNIQIYKDTNSDAQQFKFVKVDNGSYVIYTKSSKDVTCLDVAGASTSHGANIQSYTYKNASNQKWILEEAKDSGNTENPGESTSKPTYSTGGASLEYKI